MELINLSRHHWVAACEFEPVSESNVLTLIRDRVTALRAKGEPALVILDLDSTLYEVAPRTFAILKEASEVLGTELPQSWLDALALLEERGVGYSLRDTLTLLEAPLDCPITEAALEKLKEFWKARFFSNAYLTHDRPYPGTASFVKALYDIGANIVYLTGRDAPGMFEGTRRCLLRDGFPFELPRTHLFMKPDRDTDDLTYKVDVARSLKSLGTLVASFENEPRNLAGLRESFPEAIHVFVETICSENPAPVCQGIYRIRAFS